MIDIKMSWILTNCVGITIKMVNKQKATGVHQPHRKSISNKGKSIVKQITIHLRSVKSTITRYTNYGMLGQKWYCSSYSLPENKNSLVYTQLGEIFR